MEPFWGMFPAPGQADFEQQRQLRCWEENFQKVWYERSFFKKLFRKTSKLSRNIFWACWDDVVAQKSIF